MSEGLWALAGVFVGALSSGVVAVLLQKRQFAHEKEMHALENQGDENVKALLKEMLNHKSHVRRSFGAMRKKIGGYTDDELQRLLHEAGAKRAASKDGIKEWWYLATREAEYIEKLRKDA
jgi:hypothetical protein